MYLDADKIWNKMCGKAEAKRIVTKENIPP